MTVRIIYLFFQVNSRLKLFNIILFNLYLLTVVDSNYEMYDLTTEDIDMDAKRMLLLFNGKVETITQNAIPDVLPVRTFLKVNDDVQWDNANTEFLYVRDIYDNFTIQDLKLGEMHESFGSGGVGKSLAAKFKIYQLSQLKDKTNISVVYIWGDEDADEGWAYLLKSDGTGIKCIYYPKSRTKNSKYFSKLLKNITTDQHVYVVIDTVNPLYAIAMFRQKNIRAEYLFVASGSLASSKAMDEDWPFHDNIPQPPVSKDEFLCFGFECCTREVRQLLLPPNTTDFNQLVNDPFYRQLTQSEAEVVNVRLSYLHAMLGGNIRFLLRMAGVKSGMQTTPSEREIVRLAMAIADPCPTTSAGGRLGTRANNALKRWNDLEELREECIFFVSQRISMATTGTTQKTSGPPILKWHKLDSLLFRLCLDESDKKHLTTILRPSTFFMANVVHQALCAKLSTISNLLELSIGASGIGFVFEAVSLRQLMLKLQAGEIELTSTTENSIRHIKPVSSNPNSSSPDPLLQVNIADIPDLRNLETGEFGIPTNPFFPMIDGCVVVEVRFTVI